MAIIYNNLCYCLLVIFPIYLIIRTYNQKIELDELYYNNLTIIKYNCNINYTDCVSEKLGTINYEIKVKYDDCFFTKNVNFKNNVTYAHKFKADYLDTTEKKCYKTLNYFESLETPNYKCINNFYTDDDYKYEINKMDVFVHFMFKIVIVTIVSVFIFISIYPNNSHNVHVHKIYSGPS